MYNRANLPPSLVISLGRVDNPMFNRANPPPNSRILLGKGGNLLYSKANPLLSPCTKEGSLPCSKPSPLLNLFTLGGKRANRLYSKVNPLSALIVNLDKLANLNVNQLSSQFSHPFRKDNPWWRMNNRVPSKSILLAN